MPMLRVYSVKVYVPDDGNVDGEPDELLWRMQNDAEQIGCGFIYEEDKYALEEGED